MNAPLAPQNKTLLRMIMIVTGFLCFVLGVFLFIWPERGAFLLDEDLARIFGGALAFVGLTDIAIAQIMFSKKDDHDPIEHTEH